MSISLFFQGWKEGMHLFAENIAGIVNTVLLMVVYIIGVGFTSIVAKGMGKHFLEMKKEGQSYWKTLNLKKKAMDDYYRQF